MCCGLALQSSQLELPRQEGDAKMETDKDENSRCKYYQLDNM
ncbi:hypothetical protein GCM10025794_37620 [Massilia kyonggiensis]